MFENMVRCSNEGGDTLQNYEMFEKQRVDTAHNSKMFEKGGTLHILIEVIWLGWGHRTKF